MYLNFQILSMEGTEEHVNGDSQQAYKIVEHRLELEMSQMHKKTSSWMHIKIIWGTFKIYLYSRQIK